MFNCINSNINSCITTTILRNINSSNPTSKNTSKNSNKSNSKNISLQHRDSYENYNHFKKTAIPTIFYGKNETKVILDLKTKNIDKIDKSGRTDRYSSMPKNTPLHKESNGLTKLLFYNKNGGVARIRIRSVNNVFIEISDNSGKIEKYTVNYRPTINKNKYNNTPTTYYGSTGNHTPPREIVKEFNENDKSDLYILKSKIVLPTPPIPRVYKNKVIDNNTYNPPINDSSSYSAKVSGNMINSPYIPRLNSYSNAQLKSQRENIKNYKVNNANSINSEFIPIPVLNSFHSFGK